jgi:hypothetical protein
MVFKIVPLIIHSRKVISVLFFFFAAFCFSQDNIPYFLKNADWLPSQDAKKWEKLVNQIPDADKLLQKSNDCYLQMTTIEAETSTDEKKKQKQIAKLEEQAIDYYNQSLIKYREIYLDLYAVIGKNIDDSKKNHPAYKDMIFYNDQAGTIYSGIVNALTDQDREQFSQANEYQLMAIEKGVSIFNVPENSYTSTTESGTTEISSTETGASGQVTGDIQINAELYNKYKDYIDNTSVPDPVVISQLMQMEGGNASFEAFKEMWNNYLALEGEKQMQQQQIADAVVQTDSIAQQSTDSVYAQNVTNTNISQTQTESSKTAKTTKQKTNNTIPSDLFESSVPVFTDLPEYRVQLAASRTPLNLYQVTTIYKGSLSVTEVKDGNLFKYQIRSFNLFTDAQTVCSQTKVDNAYLAAYKGLDLLDLGAAIKQTRPLETQVKKLGRERVIHEIEFSVQVAASRVRLTAAQLNEIYSGQWPVSIIFEDGWYKYQILAGGNMQEALNILGNCGANKAFLVAYKNGRKLLLYKALHEYKSYTP